MFDIAWSELFLIGAVALLVVGPKDLPQLMRTVGRAVRSMKRMAGEFHGHWDDLMRESELQELRDKARALQRANLETELRKAVTDPVAPAAPAAAAAAGVAAMGVPAVATAALQDAHLEDARFDDDGAAVHDDADADEDEAYIEAEADPAWQRAWDDGPVALDKAESEPAFDAPGGELFDEPAPVLPDLDGALAVPADAEAETDEDAAAAAHRPWRAPIRNF